MNKSNTRLTFNLKIIYKAFISTALPDFLPSCGL
jgi:hypothetical protein